MESFFRVNNGNNIKSNILNPKRGTGSKENITKVDASTLNGSRPFSIDCCKDWELVKRKVVKLKPVHVTTANLTFHSNRPSGSEIMDLLANVSENGGWVARWSNAKWWR